MSDTILDQRDGGVLLLTFNRPDRMNAMSVAMETEYFDLLEAAEQDPEVRVIVITGAGRAYCVGGDVETLEKLGNRKGGTGQTPRAPRPKARTHDLPLRLAKPVISVINGACAGLGLVQAMMCDVRFASSEAKFTTAFARRGLIAEHGASWIIPRLVGRGTALDLLLSARTFRGDEAGRLGLVQFVAAPENVLPEALRYAKDLATNCSPAAIATIKSQVLSHEADLDLALSESDALMRASWKTADFREGVSSFVGKRPPHFAPYPPEELEAV